MENLEKSNKPIIYVIVPVFMTEKYLSRCIDSLVKQTYENIKVILVDDGSRDRCPEICEEYAKKYNNIVVLHQPNGGISRARNAGLNYVASVGSDSEKYIGFVDSDDWIDEKMYEVMINDIIKTNADIADVNSIVTSSESPIVRNTRIRTSVVEGKDVVVDYFVSNKVSCCRKLYKWKCWENVRFLNGKNYEDNLANCQILQNVDRVVKNSSVMYYYFKNPNSVTGKMFKEQDLVLLESCETILHMFSNDLKVRALCYEKYIWAHVSILRKYICYDINPSFVSADDIALSIQYSLRKRYKDALVSHLSIFRKIIISILVVFPIVCLRKLFHYARKKDAVRCLN